VLIALALRGADAVVALVAARSRRRPRRRMRLGHARPLFRTYALRAGALYAGLPVRGPPLAS
jgi:hypothetical protein